MNRFIKRLGVIPSLLLGAGLLTIGLLTMNHIVNNWWPFDVQRLDLVRAAALGRADPASLLDAANSQIILTFLAAIQVTVTGLTLPLVYIINKRLSHFTTESGEAVPPRFLMTLRQSMWMGFWVSFCVWLQMNRALGVAVAALVAIVLIMFEVLLQVRTRATGISQE